MVPPGPGNLVSGSSLGYNSPSQKNQIEKWKIPMPSNIIDRKLQFSKLQQKNREAQDRRKRLEKLKERIPECSE